MNKPLTLGSLFDGSGTFPMMGIAYYAQNEGK